MSEDGKLARIRHSMAHVMAEAVVEMFPSCQIAIGPAIEDGFYYDFDLPRALTEGDLEEITERMKRIIGEDKEFKRTVVSRSEAKEIFKDQKYKLELLDAIPEGEEVSIYTQGGFTDLCRGPHVESTKELNKDAFKLLSIAGAYWRGKETNPMLTRIYGTAWESPKDLRKYLDHLADIEKRDHRKLGKELDLFSLHEEAGPGLVYWHPRGARIRNVIENFWREEHYKNGYELVAHKVTARQVIRHAAYGELSADAPARAVKMPVHHGVGRVFGNGVGKHRSGKRTVKGRIVQHDDEPVALTAQFCRGVQRHAQTYQLAVINDLVRLRHLPVGFGSGPQPRSAHNDIAYFKRIVLNGVHTAREHCAHCGYRLPPIVVIAAYYDLMPFERADVVYVRLCVLYLHRPRQVAGNEHHVVFRYLFRPVALYAFEVVVPDGSENIHGFGIVYGQMKIAYGIDIHIRIISDMNENGKHWRLNRAVGTRDLPSDTLRAAPQSPRRRPEGHTVLKRAV